MWFKSCGFNGYLLRVMASLNGVKLQAPLLNYILMLLRGPEKIGGQMKNYCISLTAKIFLNFSIRSTAN